MIKVFINDIEATKDLINESIRFSNRIDLERLSFEIADVRFELSCLERDWFNLLDSQDLNIVSIFYDDRRIFKGYIDKGKMSWVYKPDNFSVEVNAISWERRFWDAVDVLLMKDIKLDHLLYTYIGFIRFPKFNIALADVLSIIEDKTGFKINIGDLEGVFFNNMNEWSFSNLKDDMPVKDFLLAVCQFYYVFLIYDPQNDELRFKKIKDIDGQLNEEIISIEISNIGNFTDALFIPAEGFKAEALQVVEYQGAFEKGLYQTTKYRYLVVEETREGFFSAPSDVVEYTTPLILNYGFVNLKLKLPETHPNIVRRYIYRASPYDYSSYGFNKDKFYLVIVVEGANEIEIWDTIADEKRQYQTVEEKIQGFWISKDEKGWVINTEKPKVKRIYEIVPKLKFQVVDKEIDNLSYTLSFFKPFKPSLNELLERFEFMLDEFYKINLKVSLIEKGLNFDVGDVIEISTLKKKVALPFSSNRGIVLEKVIEEEMVELEIWTKKIKPVKAEL
jgi:hypothetical protein